MWVRHRPNTSRAITVEWPRASYTCIRAMALTCIMLDTLLSVKFVNHVAHEKLTAIKRQDHDHDHDFKWIKQSENMFLDWSFPLTNLASTATKRALVHGWWFKWYSESTFAKLTGKAYTIKSTLTPWSTSPPPPLRVIAMNAKCTS